MIDVLAHISIYSVFWLVTLFAIIYVFRKGELNFLMSAVAICLVIRVILQFVLVDFNKNGLILTHRDEFYYEELSAYLFEYIRINGWAGIVDIRDVLGTKNFGYIVWVVLHLMVFGNNIYVVFSNIALDIITAVICYGLSVKLYKNHEMFCKIAFFLIIFNPFAVFWGSLLLKDNLLCCAVALTTYNICAMPKRLSNYILTILGLVVIGTLRFYLVPIFIILWFSSWVVIANAKSVFIKALSLISILLVGLLVLYLWVGFTTSNLSAFDVLYETKTNIERAEAENSKRDNSISRIDNRSVKGIILLFAHALLSPSPFNLTGDGKYLSLGSSFWYLLLPFVAFGFMANIKYNRSHIALILLLLICSIISTMIVMPSINEPRHRYIIEPLAVVISIGGIINSQKSKISIVSLLIAIEFLVASVKEIMVPS